MMFRQSAIRIIALTALMTGTAISYAVWAGMSAENRYPGPTLDRSQDIAGPDANGNGVRDDMDDYINGLPDTEPQKQALRQNYSTLRSLLLLDTTDTTAVVEGMRRSSASVACMYANYSEDEAARLHQRLQEAESYSVNTRERFMAYARFNSAASGHSIVLPKNGCEGGAKN
ncbi:hypothetical protein ACK32R_04760 [Aeromonas dhakensis]|uniref:hypothetical protein n=1 Tax=Aeromonas dhakensis TaxID=196024 RepID=UPI0039886053